MTVTLCSACTERVGILGLLGTLVDDGLCEECASALGLGAIPVCDECGQVDSCGHTRWRAASQWTLAELFAIAEAGGVVMHVGFLRELVLVARSVQRRKRKESGE